MTDKSNPSAFLPSSLTMYTTMLAFSYAFHPATSTPTGISRAYKATFLIAFGAIVGWPFSAALGIPFVIEQLFLTGGEIAVGQTRAALGRKRLDTMARGVALGAGILVKLILHCALTTS
jgi:alpha-1,2-mannosyltransferase